MPDRWLVQEVMNEVTARRRNEWVEETNDSYGAGDDPDGYTCECSDSDCTTSISLTRHEYEAVRADGTHFVIALNHENPLIDALVSENDRFAVVQKCFEQGRRIADENNPRH
jgi:3,4-dihydroxy-2-butanone 4-phosphate synthase